MLPDIVHAATSPYNLVTLLTMFVTLHVDTRRPMLHMEDVTCARVRNIPSRHRSIKGDSLKGDVWLVGSRSRLRSGGKSHSFQDDRSPLYHGPSLARPNQ